MKLKAIKFIWSNIPKLIKKSLFWLILLIFGDIVLKELFEIQFLISTSFAIKLLIVIVILIVVGFFWAAIVSVSKLLKMNGQRTKPEIHTKIFLQQDKVPIGRYRNDIYSVDIFARIFLDIKTKVDVSLFTERISIGKPFCNICTKTLTSTFFLDIESDGYRCTKCKSRLNEDNYSVLGCVTGEIRTNYDKYWQKYKEEINKLTGGKPENYEVPDALGIYTS